MADISTTRRLGKKRRHFRERKRVTGHRRVRAWSSPVLAAHHGAGRRRHRGPHAGQRVDARDDLRGRCGDKSALARQVGALVALRAQEKGFATWSSTAAGSAYHGRSPRSPTAPARTGWSSDDRSDPDTEKVDV
jgi:large subunit ribosomal protein L18